MLKLQVIVASARPGRAGLPVATWVDGVARRHGQFDVRLVDLAEVNLPLFDEPRHPRLRQYEHAHTKAWSAVVAEADAFVFVTPEYNFSPPPSLVNAIDFLHGEWAYKAAAFVSYGGVAGGARGVQVAKLMLTTLKVMPIFETVVLPFFAQHIKDGVFEASEANETSAKALLDELARWAGALRPLRGG
jgi:NAD(P)H-dependent FMN reductase